VAGTGHDGGTPDGGRALDSDVGDPGAIAFDGQGRLLAWLRQLSLIRRIEDDGTLRTAVGSVGAHEFLRAGALATSGRVETMQGFAHGPHDEIYYLTNEALQVWRVDAETGTARPFAGRGSGPPSGPADEALAVSLEPVAAMAVDDTGNLYLAERTGAVRRIDVRTLRVSTVVPGTDHLLHPTALLPVGSDLYVSDANGYVWRVGLDGRPTPVAGGGRGF